MVVAIDFDGSCTTHAYPLIGNDIGAVPILKRLVDNGHKLMLWTMRGNKPHGGENGVNTLQEAVDWFKSNEVPLWGINQNPTQQKSGWSNSHKQHAELYIDDAALGAPLMFNPEISDRPYLNWVVIEEYLTKRGLI
jgi:hypothetical protein